MNSQYAIEQTLKGLIELVRKEHYIDGSKVSDADCLGIILAKYLHWDGTEILRATYAGLEDSNFHSENRIIKALIEKLEGVESGGL